MKASGQTKRLDRCDGTGSWFNTEKVSPEQEMVQDLMAITHCFSSRYKIVINDMVVHQPTEQIFISVERCSALSNFNPQRTRFQGHAGV
jgi:hypothetical protein